jgi:hypothetical protein
VPAAFKPRDSCNLLRAACMPCMCICMQRICLQLQLQLGVAPHSTLTGQSSQCTCRLIACQPQKCSGRHQLPAANRQPTDMAQRLKQAALLRNTAQCQ